MTIELSDIEAARERIKDIIQPTPTEHSRNASEWIGTEVFLKYENYQRTGSFKIRGALNKVLTSTQQQREKGFIAASAGNHAQGVAFSATHVGAKSKIIMPLQTPMVKRVATVNYGAEVELHGRVFDDCYTYAKEQVEKFGYTFVHAFDDPVVIAGQGTIGLEIIEAIPDLDSVIVAVGGGGLISGMATAIKTIRPQCKVYGAVATNAPGMHRLFNQQSYNPQEYRPTIADGIAVKSPSPSIYENYLSRLVDDVVAVDDDDIAKAIVFLLERSKAMVEGAGAIGLAAAARGKWNLGRKSCVLLCGGNIDLNLVSQVIEKGLSESGRIARFTVIVEDRPGTLNELTELLANKEANILEVHHDRLRPDLRLRETAIDFLVETKNDEHVAQIRATIDRIKGAKFLVGKP